MTRTQKWLVVIAGLLIGALATLYFLDWNLLRPYIEHRIAATTGRNFAINGDPRVQLSLRPRITANGIVKASDLAPRAPRTKS